MISEVDKDSLVLNTALLRNGDSGDKFCIVKKIVNKIDVNGKPYIQMIVRGKNGKQIAGRLFGDTVFKYLDSINLYADNIVLIGYNVTEVYGEKALDVSYIVLPEGDELKGINSDLFNAVIPNVETYVNSIKETFLKYPCVFTEPFLNFFNQNLFTSLLYKSDTDVCNGYDGYVYVLLSSVWDRLAIYHELGYFKKNIIGMMFCAQLLCECLIASVSNNEFHYNARIYHKVYNCVVGIKVGTAEERRLLIEIASNYLDMRLEVEPKTETRYSRVLYTEFMAIYNNLKYLTALQNTGTISVYNNKFVR